MRIDSLRFSFYVIFALASQTDPNKPVLLAGDKEKNNMEAVDKAGGIQYLENQLQTCAMLAEKLKIEPLKFN